MILVRDVMQVKFGQMDQVLAGLKGAEGQLAAMRVSRILTDVSGPYFTLVIETRAESVDAYWQAMQEGFAMEEAGTSPFVQYIESGYREFYTIEYEAGS